MPRFVGRLGLCAAIFLGLASGSRAASYPLDIVSGPGDVVSAPAKRAPKTDRYGWYTVYLADADIDGLEELWSVSLLGGDPVKISDTMLPGDHVDAFEVSPNGDGTVAYLASYSGGPVQLYLASVTANFTPILMNQALDPGGYVDSFSFTPDGDWLVYSAQTDPGVLDFFRVKKTGGGPAQPFSFTSAQPSCKTRVDRWAFNFKNLTTDTPSVAFRVLYVCNDVPGQQSLHRAVLSDTTASTVAMGVSVADVFDFQFNGPVLLTYLIDPDGSFGPQSAIVGWDDLTAYAADHHVGAAVVSGGTVTSILTLMYSDYVVYRADSDVDEKYELYVTTVGQHGVTATPVQLHDELPFTSVADVYRVTQTGRVVFVRLASPGDGVDAELRSSSLLAPGSSTLLATVPSPGIFERLEVTYYGERAIFRADKDEAGRVELYSVPAAGGAIARLNPTFNILFTTWDVHDFAVAPDESHLVYVYETEDLFSGNRLSQVRSSPVEGGGSVPIGPILDPATHDGFLFLGAPIAYWSPLEKHWGVTVHDAATPGVRRITLSDDCVFCDGFFPGPSRWN